jgi:hypothetical protein
VFLGVPRAWVRLKLKSGSWIGGVFMGVEGAESYAARYPEDQDIYLALTLELDPVTGDLQIDAGKVATRPGGILVRWEEVEYMEFVGRLGGPDASVPS